MSDPSWLIAAIDQRLALMSDAIQRAQTGGYGIIMSPLTEPPENATDEEYKVWDQSCDNCGRHVPKGLYTGNTSRDVGLVQVVIVFGVCAECKDSP